MARKIFTPQIKERLLSGEWVSATDLGAELGVPPGSITALVRRMQGNGHRFKTRREGRKVLHRLVTQGKVEGDRVVVVDASEKPSDKPEKFSEVLRRRLLAGETLTSQAAVEIGASSALFGFVVKGLETQGYRFKKQRVGFHLSHTLVSKGRSNTLVKANGHTGHNGHETQWLPVPQHMPPLGSLCQITALVIDGDGKPAILLRSQDGVSFGASLTGVHIPA